MKRQKPNRKILQTYILFLRTNILYESKKPQTINYDKAKKLF